MYGSECNRYSRLERRFLLFGQRQGSTGEKENKEYRKSIYETNARHNCVHEATKGKKRRNRVNRNEWWEHVIVGDNQFSTNSLTVLWGLCWLRFGALCWLRFVTGLPFWDTSSMPQGPNPHMSVLLVEIWGDLEVCFRSVPPNRHDILYRSIWGLGKHKWWKWSLTLILMY